MKAFFLVVLVCLALVPCAAADDPPPSSPGASCTMYHLPDGAFVEKCDGDYVIRLPDLP